MTSRILTLGAVLILMIATGAPAVETVMQDGVPHVINTAVPRDGVQALQLEEMWRRGGEDDEELLLGIVTRVLSGQDGNLYVLDSQLMEVKVFDADGEHVDTLGRQGQGPGEFQSAQSIVFLPGGSLGVVQAVPGKVIALNLDGTPGNVITLGQNPADGGFAILQDAANGGDTFAIAGIEIHMAPDAGALARDMHMFVRGYDMEGNKLQTYYERVQRSVFGEGFVLREIEWDNPIRRFAVDGEGQVIMGLAREEYELSVYGPDGELQRVFSRPYESYPRSEMMRSRYDRMLEAQARQMSPDGAREVAANEQDIWNIRCHGDGTYWIQSSRDVFEPPTGTFTAWDVFSAEGEYLRQVTATIPGTPGEDLLFMTDHGQAVQITGFWDAVLSAMGAGSDEDAEGDPMEIICYAIR